MDRRKALKSGLLLSGGIAFFGKSLFANSTSKVASKPNYNYKTEDLYAFETTPPEIKARLCFNENPFGPSKKAREAASKEIPESYMYPFKEIQELAQKIADFEGLQPHNISLSNGSTPYLLSAAIVYGKGTILTATPTYEDLPSRAESYGSKVIRIPLDKDYRFDLDAIEKNITADTSLIYICNPNNPTGTLVDNNKLKDFCRRVSKKTMILIDEAYIDLVPDPKNTTVIPLIKEGCNIMVARTFSKLYGLAGMRIGYIVGQEETVKQMAAYTTGGFGIAYPSIAAASVSYQDQEFMQYAYKEISDSRKYMYAILEKHHLKYVPTTANFLVFPLAMDSEQFVKKMAAEGVAIRSWKINGGNWCRASIGTKKQLDDFDQALTKVLS